MRRDEARSLIEGTGLPRLQAEHTRAALAPKDDRHAARSSARRFHTSCVRSDAPYPNWRGGRRRTFPGLGASIRDAGGTIRSTDPQSRAGTLNNPTITRRVAAVLLAAYGLVVILIVAWPVPVDKDAHGFILKLLRLLHERDLLMFLGYAQIEFTANVAMFVPIGVLVGVLFGRRHWGWAVGVGFAASSAIELAQWVLLPGRYGTPDDVIANTLGTLVGALLAGSFLRHQARQQQATDAVTTPRSEPDPTGGIRI
ncbi:VanZ family protein [Herbiconiux daphne]|uniref:VanZ family protein n=1 Tax=Herbiconiux daphne TaxID=2970914 RepID=A0ABT2H6H8_9MICO|nr:VanZ family protein [Herbiconiux daphne]MCS5735546.1 VanZ family protein [Herbiconiux daphne]